MKLLMIALISSSIAAAVSGTPYSFDVEVTGKGSPMILIPGFASSGKVWDSTVAHYKDRYECHVLTLAGFAGQPPTGKTPFLETVRDDIAAYIRDKKLMKPVIIGHSMGGFLALWVAARNPGLTGPLVIVDSLPFFTAAMNPNATAESAKPMAAMMKQMYMAQTTPEQQEKSATASIRPMVTKDSDFATVMQWTRTSDRPTMGNAMAELLSTDIRDELQKITIPVVVYATWIAYKDYGGKERTEAQFRKQYASLKQYNLVLFDTARHFIMLDDPAGFDRETDRFLASQRERPATTK